MGGVTQRQRFLGSLLGKGIDRFPFFDIEPDEDTLRRWHDEGLPRQKSFSKHFCWRRTILLASCCEAILFSKWHKIFSTTRLLSNGIITLTNDPVMQPVM